jgi:hypothetical protein
MRVAASLLVPRQSRGFYYTLYTPRQSINNRGIHRRVFRKEDPIFLS